MSVKRIGNAACYPDCVQVKIYDNYDAILEWKHRQQFA